MPLLMNVKLLDRILPPIDDPTLTAEQRDRKERERRHNVFAFVLILGAMLMLPISGAIYVILIKLGVLGSPI